MTDPIEPNDHTSDPDELLPDPVEAEFVDEHQDDEPAGHVYHDDETDVVLPPEPPLPPDSGDIVSPRPIYHMPFDCAGGFYRGTTYPGHSSYSVDFNGVDGHDIGDLLHAMLAGRVYFLYPPNGQIHVEDANGWGWILAHTINPRVKVGDWLKVGDHFADLGNTGIGSTGPHAHVNLTRHRVPVQVVLEGKPYSASVPVNAKYRSGPLLDCGLVIPPPKPEAVVKVKTWAGWAGSTVEVVAGASIENADGVEIAKAVTTVMPYLGETPNGRVAAGVLTKGESIAAYVKPKAAGGTSQVVAIKPPAGVDPKALERAAATGFNEGLDSAEAVVSGIPHREVPA